MGIINDLFSLFNSGESKDISVDPFKDNEALRKSIRNKSISISQSYKDLTDSNRFAQIMYKSFTEGLRAEGVAKKFSQELGIGQKDLEFIFLKAFSGLSTELRRARYKDAGCLFYIWYTVSDNKACPICKERDRRIFSWDEPPEGGHPGECLLCPNRCRCIARPVVGEVYKIHGEYVLKGKGRI